MASYENNWTTGEIVTLPRKSSKFKSSGLKTYEYIVGSRYICIREANGSECGILLKVLGKAPREHIMIANGEPFCKDDKNEGFANDSYFGYRFPTTEEVKLILGILRHSPELVETFEQAKMHINPNSSYWVRETVRDVLLKKKPQIYDSRTDALIAVSNDSDIHYRLSIVYFTRSKLDW
jgi:hypothetical protein